MVLNSDICVVICVRLFIAMIPIVKQMMLETKARINQSNKPVRNSDDITIRLTQAQALCYSAYKPSVWFEMDASVIFARVSARNERFEGARYAMQL